MLPEPDEFRSARATTLGVATVPDSFESSGNPSSDDTSEYLQIFLDETEEQLDHLVETLLVLERNVDSADDLNEAFRLIHSIKGAAGMMGFDTITVLTHQLENRFEQFRSGLRKLDQPTMNVVLRCIDFLRDCNYRLREGEQLGGATELLDELRALDEQAPGETAMAASHDDQPSSSPGSQAAEPEEAAGLPAQVPDGLPDLGAGVRVNVAFEAGLQLADLKARLIISRLSVLGEVRSTRPTADELEGIEELAQFEVVLETERDAEQIRAAADVDGVHSIELDGQNIELKVADDRDDSAQDEPLPDDAPSQETAAEMEDTPPAEQAETRPVEQVESTVPQVATETPPPDDSATPEPVEPASAVSSELSTPAEKAKAKVAETMRVDIDRLDNLMNLAGELVVNRARFVQVSGQVSPALRKTSVINRARDFSGSLRRTIDGLKNLGDADGSWTALIQELEGGLALMDEQSELWENSRRCFGQINEAIDQLTSVSDDLQQGVLKTRMVPVGPLFNRFKRVVRDLAVEKGKQVNLQIRGEKTELDKRMIDELGDPLVHLVRNSIDHGLESPELRIERGKSEQGTIVLEASHSGNNVFIHIRDDGGGIDVGTIKARLVNKAILTAVEVDELSDEQVIDYIWHPGFSTAKEITDISGRGVGMDVVKTRIADLNGNVDVRSTPEQGTTFVIRLPLTLAIINSLLVRIRDVVFSMPIDDVREIVSVQPGEIVAVHGKQTFDVRGEFIPLVGIDDVFKWHDVQYGYRNGEQQDPTDREREAIDVVILHSGGKTLGLRVEEMIGGQDIVIKSLSDNFVHIRGLSGASILGDGTVCLMIDVGTVIDMAINAARKSETRKEAQLDGAR